VLCGFQRAGIFDRLGQPSRTLNFHSHPNIATTATWFIVRDNPAFENRKGWGSLIVEVP